MEQIVEQLEHRRRIVHRHSGDSEIEAIVASSPANDPIYRAAVARRDASYGPPGRRPYDS
jgi:hypothetical protein